MMYKEHYVDFCVVGGGLSGVCAAISAARRGIKVAIMQDRPMFGGNASSEIRMWSGGAHGDNMRETGIHEEICLENFYRNESLSYNVWDSVIFGKVKAEKNIKVFLNCTCQKADCEDGVIKSITGWQLTTETYHTVYAKYFADCSGDSILAPLTGAEFMLGREAKSDFGETIPPDVADKKTMGMSCLFQIRETEKPTKFIPPEWAYKYETDEMLNGRPHDVTTNYWWIELGGEQDSIHDTEELRDELLKIAFGVWDHMKNYGDHGVDNWELDWIGFLPGKRESRRYVGDYVVTQNDVEAAGPFDDAIAYGGWSMDDHFPEGFYYKGGHPTIYHPAPSPWRLPYRAVYSKNIKNLFFAGRNISVTHAALSSCRVMSTCSLLGQAVGTAAAIAVNDNTTIRGVDIKKLQQHLMEDDCFLPGFDRAQSELTLKAKTDYPDVKNGKDRADESGYNGYIGKKGDVISYKFDSFEKISKIRLVFDSNLNRPRHNMPHNKFLNEPDFRVPKTLIKDYDIIAVTPDGEKVIVSVNDNCQRFVNHAVDVCANEIKLVLKDAHGDDGYRVISMDLY